jgi:signal transduction histidine kinase
VKTFEYRISSLRPIFADETQLSQLFSNLINNASKAMTESGKKLQNIFIECNTDTDHPNLLDILIKDTGKGIAKKDLDKIFNEGFSTKK